jgi:hypothetical protein
MIVSYLYNLLWLLVVIYNRNGKNELSEKNDSTQQTSAFWNDKKRLFLNITQPNKFAANILFLIFLETKYSKSKVISNEFHLDIEHI